MSTLYSRPVDAKMLAWVTLNDNGILHVADAEDTTVVEEIFTVRHRRQLHFRDAGEYEVEVEFWANGGNVTATLDGEPLAIGNPRAASQHAYEPATLYRFTFLVTVEAGQVITFSRQPVDKKTKPL